MSPRLLIGSPPCVRGAGPCRGQIPTSLRFTPVRTGSSLRAGSKCQTPAVHPRAYGEQRSTLCNTGFGDGSPPCVRGAADKTGEINECLRFTPVRTGSSWRASARAVPFAVHPRAYGEQIDRLSFQQRDAGSPPCVRGAGVVRASEPDVSRFTPVRTGSRNGKLNLPFPVSVHPRAYGEQFGWSGSGRDANGSPPCVRGAVRCLIKGCGECRFTPVRTGSRPRR